MTNPSYGRRSNPEYPMPQIPNYQVTMRTVTVVDPDIPTAEAAGVINLLESRFGADNKIYIDVIAATFGATTITLYKKIGTDYIYIAEQTTTKAKQELRFLNLMAGVYVPVVSGAGLVNPTVLNGGGTK